MQLGLLITNRCNAACSHCATSCGPDRNDYLPESALLRVMDEAAALHREYPKGRLEFCISGGEPFLDMVLLESIISHGTSLGGVVSCQTNGYWASNDIKARLLLKRVKGAGLKSLGVSVSRFHDPFIKRSRVERALSIAKSLGMETALKCGFTAGDDEIQQWAKDCVVDSREIFPIHPYLREGAQLPADSYFTTAEMPEGGCPAAVLTLREDGHVYTCCSPGGFNTFLRVGNAHTMTLQEVNDQFHIGGRQQLLRRHGPSHFAQEIIRRGEGARLRERYADVCDLCCHIGNDPVMSQIAAETAEHYEQEQMRELFAAMEQAVEC